MGKHRLADDDSLYVLKEEMDNEESQKELKKIEKECGSRGPFLGRKVHPNHIVLLNQLTEKPVYKNALGSTSINMGFVERWKW